MKKASTAMSSTLRCLKVLELLAEEPFELSFTDLAAKLEIPKASAHRLCTTLIEANLIVQEPVTRRYMLSSHALWVGSGYLRHSPIYRAAFFPMQDLARQVPGTVQLGVLDQDYVLFIHSVGYSGAPHAFADVGLRRPLNATASGKIFLAGMSQEDVERIMAKSAEKYTSSTITSIVKMKQEITQVRKIRYARNVEELLPGYWVLAAGVGGQENSPAAAISLTLPLDEFSPESEVAISALVKEAARKASLQLGHAGAGQSIGHSRRPPPPITRSAFNHA
ncbi:IclR family transcriptional regulator [Tunturiibacter empetritectus]|uniref:DNA-binding IclR family transcriptional regulator n=2 Tax=Tunturiibacter TaxID=3154218 RepID=A0A852VK64_9BACT|nr:IclR family transcriptional regulator [Edaphobacter lichenicola]NYF89906.1 DNA-binding IclR family transcriptional regulator [Edaphobacter lichenicola]